MNCRTTEQKIQRETNLLSRLETIRGKVITINPKHDTFKNIGEITFEIGEKTRVEITATTNNFFRINHPERVVLVGLRCLKSSNPNELIKLGTEDNYTYFFGEIWYSYNNKKNQLKNNNTKSGKNNVPKLVKQIKTINLNN